ncbi:hypothetical protein V493_00882 [Pseudogymnoascus sp. VKM F-4281 (FW-2241)]|nr:hypothetical protein V493_00882 [Pseudogymnoascus sp. VKM F-4281 (FW-2241)]
MFRATQAANPDGTAVQFQNYSLSQYNLAVKCTHRLLAKSQSGDSDLVVKGLVACVLFVCYENLVGNYRIAQMHLQNGLKILPRAVDGHGKQCPTVPNNIVQVLNRLDLQAMSFADSEAPYPYHLCQDLSIPTSSPSFSSITDATDHLVETFRWIFWLAASSEPNPIPKWQLDATSTVLQQWEKEFDRLVAFLPADDRNTIVLLKMYHTTMTIMMATGLYGQETLHDEHHGLYEHIVALGKALFIQQKLGEPADGYIFCFETGIIFPLFFVAIKCRHPLIRRQAITLLETANHQEGSWDSFGAAKVAEFVMGVEETNLPHGGGAEHVLESARVHMVNVSANIERRRVDLMCLRRTSEEDSWYFTEGTVFF